jgi:prepilin signal peptidase PulO-like enzyme (type II secretory pathway)
MKCRCPQCGQHTLPVLRVLFMVSRTHGVECTSCHSVISRPFWLFLLLALNVPGWIIWVKMTDPPSHIATYGLQVMAVWALFLFIVAPLKQIRVPLMPDSKQG